MNILFLSPDYPDDRRSNFYFVKQLVDEMARQGHRIQVVAPYSITHNKRFYKHVEEQTIGEGCVIIYRPYCISFSNLKIGSFSPTEFAYRVAYNQGLKMLRERPDIVYGHFWDSAYKGYNYAKKNNLPLFVATGESEIVFRSDSSDKKDFCKYISGVVCVSSKNKKESVYLGLTTSDKCIVIPNAIDSALFRPLERKKCRQKLNLPNDAFIVSFVGWFNERKGSERLSKAVSSIKEGKTVYTVFIGDGQAEPLCDNMLYKGRLPHDKIPEYLCASDVFVLPTLQEGCCNAVIEAMACGLPIVSSNLPFNWDVLNDSNSILVDPTSINEIAEAIIELRDNISKRTNLAEGAVKTASSLTIDKRASSIIDFVENLKGDKTKTIDG